MITPEHYPYKGVIEIFFLLDISSLRRSPSSFMLHKERITVALKNEIKLLSKDLHIEEVNKNAEY